MIYFFDGIIYSKKSKTLKKIEVILMIFDRKKYLDELIDKKNNSLIKVITGARRSGKSYLMNELFYRHLLSTGVSKENIIRFAFDNPEPHTC